MSDQGATPTGPLQVVATIEAKPGHGDAAAALLAGALAGVHAEEGCLRYDLFRVRRDPDTLVMIEEWESSAALKAHGSSPEFAALGARLAEHLAGPPAVRVLDAVPPASGE